MATLVGQYKVFIDDESSLGEGTFGNVWKGRDVVSKMDVAVKRIKLPDDKEFEKKYLDGEVDALKSALHPNIVGFYHAEKKTKYLYLFMDLCEGGDLDSYITTHDKLSEDTLLSFM